MNKQQALEDFKASFNYENPNGFREALKRDKLAVALAWGFYKEVLFKDGEITLKQYQSWTNPF